MSRADKIFERKRCELCGRVFLNDEYIECVNCGKFFCPDCMVKNNNEKALIDKPICLICDFFKDNSYKNDYEKYWLDFRKDDALYCDNCFNELSLDDKYYCSSGNCNGEFCSECYDNHICFSDKRIMERRNNINRIIGECFKNDIKKVRQYIELDKLNEGEKLKYGVCSLIAIENENLELLYYLYENEARLNNLSLKIVLKRLRKFKKSFSNKVIRLLFESNLK